MNKTSYDRMKALPTACKTLILLGFHRSFNDTPTIRSVLIGSEYPAKALRILFTSIATQNARLCGGLTIMSEHYEQLPHHREFVGLSNKLDGELGRRRVV